MPTPFKDAAANLKNLIAHYNSARDVLFQSYEIYSNNTNVKQYDAAIMGLNLFSTIEYAQNVNQFYEKTIHTGTITTKQIKSLDAIFDKFKDQCEADQIYYTLPSTRLILDKNQTASAANLPEIASQLHLYAAYLNGIGKINSAVGGEYLQMVFGSTGYGGVATPGGRLFIDLQMLANPQDIFHIMLHEYEHYVDFRRTGDSLDKSHLSTLPLIIPSFLRSAPNDSQQKEIFADMGAALTAALYKIPLSYAFSRFAAYPALSPNQEIIASHPGGDKRAEMMQTVISVLRKHFNENKFGKESNRWKSFADDIQARSQLRFKEFPTLADLRHIYNSAPTDPAKQLAELQKQCPALFAPTTRGDKPPPVLVDARIRQQVMGQQFSFQRLDTLPLTTIAEFQKGGPLQVPAPTSFRPFPPALAPSFTPPAIRPSFAPFPPAIRPSFAPFPPAIRPSFAPFPPAIRPTFAPLQPQVNPRNYLSIPATLNSNSTLMSPATLGLDTASANLMLGAVLIDIGNKTLHWAFPRWMQANKTANASLAPTALPTAGSEKKLLQRAAP